MLSGRETHALPSPPIASGAGRDGSRRGAEVFDHDVRILLRQCSERGHRAVPGPLEEDLRRASKRLIGIPGRRHLLGDVARQRQHHRSPPGGLAQPHAAERRRDLIGDRAHQRGVVDAESLRQHVAEFEHGHALVIDHDRR